MVRRLHTVSVDVPASAESPEVLKHATGSPKKSHGPSVELKGSLMLSGGWTLTSYVNPRDSDIVTISLEREKPVELLNAGDGVEQPRRSCHGVQDIPTEDPREGKASPPRQFSRSPGPSPSPHGSPKASSAAEYEVESNRLPTIHASPQSETSDQETNDIGEAELNPHPNEDQEVVPTPSSDDDPDIFVVRMGPKKPRSLSNTHPSSIPRNIAGLGARRSTQMIDGFKERLLAEKAAERRARELAMGDGKQPSGAADKRKASGDGAGGQLAGRSVDSGLRPDQDERETESIDEAEELQIQEPVKKKRGRSKKRR